MSSTIWSREQHRYRELSGFPNSLGSENSCGSWDLWFRETQFFARLMLSRDSWFHQAHSFVIPIVLRDSWLWDTHGFAILMVSRESEIHGFIRLMVPRNSWFCVIYGFTNSWFWKIHRFTRLLHGFAKRLDGLARLLDGFGRILDGYARLHGFVAGLICGFVRLPGGVTLSIVLRESWMVLNDLSEENK